MAPRSAEMTESPPAPYVAPDTGSSSTRKSAHTSDSAAVKGSSRLPAPRSLPPWIDSYEKQYGPASPDQLQLLHAPPRAAEHRHHAIPQEPARRTSKDGFVAWDDPRLGQPQSMRSRIPHFLRYGRASMRGRKWDHLRSAEPVVVSSYRPVRRTPTISWGDFVHSSSWGRMANENAEVVDYEYMNSMQPTFNDDMEMQLKYVDSRPAARKKGSLSKRIWNGIMRHPLSPLLFRLGVMVTSILALGLSARIYKLENVLNSKSSERNQSIVAVAVDCVAIPYIGYMIYDEYMGKPLGLRSAMSKIRLILLDLFFIIFKSASTALAFESFIYHSVSETVLVRLSMALASFQFIGLASWSMTFTINIFRTVKRLGGGDNDDDDSRP